MPRLRLPAVSATLSLALLAGTPATAPVTPATAPVAPSVDANRPVAVSTSAIVPGTVNRSSINLRATYDVSVWLSYASRQLATDSRMTVTNTSGASIDRLELNTSAARLGSLRIRSTTVDGRAVSARIDDQTVIVPLGGILPAGVTVHVRLRTRSWLRTSLSGSSWMYTKAN